MGFIAQWIVTGIAIVVAQRFVSGIDINGFGTVALAALALGFINATIKPLLQLLSLPLTILTLGLFYLVVNGACFGLAAFLVPGFRVTSLGAAIGGSLIVSLISWLFALVLGRSRKHSENRS